jgi:RimJ/RimL family protein N-acetyltransferase
VFAVESDGCFAGRVGLLHPADWPEPELSWTLASRFWGRGLATEAATEVRRWAFAQGSRTSGPFSAISYAAGSHASGTYASGPKFRLVSYIVPENARSGRVAEKLGAVRDSQIVLRGFLADVWVHPAPGRGVLA